MQVGHADQGAAAVIRSASVGSMKEVALWAPSGQEQCAMAWPLVIASHSLHSIWPQCCVVQRAGEGGWLVAFAGHGKLGVAPQPTRASAKATGPMQATWALPMRDAPISCGTQVKGATTPLARRELALPEAGLAHRDKEACQRPQALEWPARQTAQQTHG